MAWIDYLFGLRGRISREKYWLFVLISVITLAGAGAVLNVAAILYPAGVLGIIVTWTLNLALLVVGSAICIKRLHDRNKSGWWLLIFYSVLATVNLLQQSSIGPLGVLAAIMPFGVLAGAVRNGLGTAALLTGDINGWTATQRIKAALHGPGVAQGERIVDAVSFAVFLWTIVELGCLRGTVGENQYGPDPLGPDPVRR